MLLKFEKMNNLFDEIFEDFKNYSGDEKIGEIKRGFSGRESGLPARPS
jgi:hypothetical protein